MRVAHQASSAQSTPEHSLVQHTALHFSTNPSMRPVHQRQSDGGGRPSTPPAMDAGSSWLRRAPSARPPAQRQDGARRIRPPAVSCAWNRSPNLINAAPFILLVRLADGRLLSNSSADITTRRAQLPVATPISSRAQSPSARIDAAVPLSFSPSSARLTSLPCLPIVTGPCRTTPPPPPSSPSAATVGLRRARTHFALG